MIKKLITKVTMKNHSQSKQLYERACKSLAGGVSSEFRKYSYPHPLFYKKGSGAHIVDVDDNDYLDFTLSQGPLILGHSHPKVLKRVQEYSENGQLFAGQHLLELELAEKLQSIIPCAEMMRFSLSGSESVHAAIRLARACTKRQKLIRFEGHYDGWFDEVAYGISAPSEEALGSREHPNVIPWTNGLPTDGSKSTLILPWNDLNLIEKTISSNKDEIAAIITEPIMCNNGCIMPKKGFLDGLREICDRNGIILIFDEVITGFRMSIGGAQKYFNVIPDLAIFGKALANGYPISLIAGKRKYMQLMADGTAIHAGTINSCNPCIAAAASTIEILERDNTHQKLFALGKRLKDGLMKIKEENKLNMLVQGPGPMLHISFTSLKEVHEYRDTFHFDKQKLKLFVSGLHEEGVRIIGRGLWYISNAHTEADIDFAIDKSSIVLKDFAKKSK